MYHLLTVQQEHIPADTEDLTIITRTAITDIGAPEDIMRRPGDILLLEGIETTILTTVLICHTHNTSMTIKQAQYQYLLELFQELIAETLLL